MWPRAQTERVRASSRPGLPADLQRGSCEERLAPGCSQVQLSFRYESRDQRFTVCVARLTDCSSLCRPADQNMYAAVPPRVPSRQSSWRRPCFHGCRVSCSHVRVVALPCVEATCCLFRTRGRQPQDAAEVNEVFGMQISHSALRHKTLRVDVCSTSKLGHEQCLVSGAASLLLQTNRRWW